MTEINALQRTQRVIVNQANSGKVTVINAGPIGPTGVAGADGLDGSAPAGGYTFTQTEDTPPASPNVGDTWFAPDTGFTYLYFDEDGVEVWLQSAYSGTTIPEIDIDGGDASTTF